METEELPSESITTKDSQPNYSGNPKTVVPVKCANNTFVISHICNLISLICHLIVLILILCMRVSIGPLWLLIVYLNISNHQKKRTFFKDHYFNIIFSTIITVIFWIEIIKLF